MVRINFYAKHKFTTIYNKKLTLAPPYGAYVGGLSMNNQTVNASSIANYFIERAEKEDNPMSLMKLVKLVYIAHGWSLALLNKPLLDWSEKVEAWKYGPVIPSLYHEFKRFGASPFPKGIRSIYFLPDDREKPVELKPHFEYEYTKVLNIVWELYGNKTGTELMKLTHQNDTPWSNSYQENEKYISISDDKIKEHFTALIQELTKN